MLHSVAKLLVLVLLAAIGSPAHAIDYPTRTVRLVIPYPAGGSAEVQARALGEQLSAVWKQPVIVENRPGAGTTVGAAAVAASPPDGYTLYLASTSHTISPSLYKSLRYDVVASFAPVSRLASSPFLVLVHPKSGIDTIADLLALARRRPGELNYSTSGIGAGSHFSGEMLAAMTKIEVRHVPINGSGPAVIALLGQHVDFSIGDMAALSQVQDGGLKALAVTSLKRIASLPNVPTLDETVAPGFEITNWSAILAPAGTPEEIVSFVNASIIDALKTAKVRQILESQGFETSPTTPEALRAHMTSEVRKYAELAKLAGIKGQ